MWRRTYEHLDTRDSGNDCWSCGEIGRAPLCKNCYGRKLRAAFESYEPRVEVRREDKERYQ